MSWKVYVTVFDESVKTMLEVFVFMNHLFYLSCALSMDIEIGSLASFCGVKEDIVLIRLQYLVKLAEINLCSSLELIIGKAVL